MSEQSKASAQKQEDFLLDSFRCLGKKDKFKLLKAALKAAGRPKAA